MSRWRPVRAIVPGDEGSTNGTTVDGQPVTAKIEIPLDPGATIGLGQGTTLRFDLS
ncbi:MAG: Inner rane component of cytoplasmic domain [Anaerolineales bacterium]|jgi:pSer/pThr/pTyr-binding forkhead associated (FHA) protein|nr:Inner membrane component of T3SS, cytoplasmic domain [Anaerolineales bacterium]MBM2842879.1 Inner rane component of cytoplasmic domain [Anaerolineales bacterium]